LGYAATAMVVTVRHHCRHGISCITAGRTTGQTRRTAYGETLAGQQENRRVIFVFNYAK
jgi:hypothetical protein